MLAVTVLHASTFVVAALAASAYLPWLGNRPAGGRLGGPAACEAADDCL